MLYFGWNTVAASWLDSATPDWMTAMMSTPSISTFPLSGEEMDRSPSTLTLNLADPLAAMPEGLSDWNLKLAADGHELVYEFDTQAEATGVPSLLRRMSDLGLSFKDLHTKQSSLEDIFVGLVHKKEEPA